MVGVGSPEDPTIALEAVLPALPHGVGCSALQVLGGGPLKQGSIFLESGRLDKRWLERWFVLWPKVPHPVFGHLLFDFASRDATTANDCIQLINQVIRQVRCKTKMNGVFCYWY